MEAVAAVDAREARAEQDAAALPARMQPPVTPAATMPRLDQDAIAEGRQPMRVALVRTGDRWLIEKLGVRK